MNKKAFYLLVFFCIAFLCLFLYLIFKSFTTPPTTPSTPPPTPSDSPKTQYIDDTSEPKEPEKAEEISRLIDKTPYQGAFFSFTYDLNTALFTVNIDPANESEGEKEFNKFLNQNGIPNKSYIIGLKTTKLPLH